MKNNLLPRTGETALASEGRFERWLRSHFFVFFILAFLGLLVYSNTFESAFHFDDVNSILKNESIKNLGDPGAVWHFWPTRFVTYLTLALNTAWNGQQHVFGYHVFNLIVHLGASFLVYVFSLSIFATPALKGGSVARHARLLSFFTALIFEVHPVQTQAVTYIIQRATSLAALFYLASLYLYVRSRLLDDKKQKTARFCYAGSLVAALLAMYAKEMAITLPAMIFLFEFCFLKGPEGIRWRRLVPFFLTCALIPLTMLLSRSVDLVQMRRVSEGALLISSGEYLLTQFRVLVTYLRLFLLPVAQNLDYDYPVARSLADPSVLVSFFVLTAVFISGLRLFSKVRILAFGIFWFFLTLLPESSVIPIRDVIFEHRLYLPMAGLSLFAVSGVYYVMKEAHLKRTIAILLAAALVFSVLTYRRNFVWKDNFTLWADVIKKSPLKGRSYNDRGNAYARIKKYKEALADYNKVIELSSVRRAAGQYESAAPGLTLAASYFNRGVVFSRMGDEKRALEDFDKAIETDPSLAPAYGQRAIIYFHNRELVKSLSDVRQAGKLNYPINPKFLEALKLELQGRHISEDHV
jgi:hypothetical protein